MNNQNTIEERQFVPEDEISLKDFLLKLQDWFMYVVSHWSLIVVTGIIGSSIGLTYAYTKKPMYVAELSFVLEENQSSGGLGAYSGLASMVGIDLGNNGGGIFVGDNLVEFMKSRSMIEKTLLSKIKKDGREVTLAQFYIDINGLSEIWKKNPQLTNISFLPDEDPLKFARQKDSLLSVFYKNIIDNNITVAKKDKKLSILTLTVKTGNELFSKYFAEILVKVVSDFYIQTKTKRSEENMIILERQTDSIRRTLNYAINDVASSIDANPNPNPSRQVLKVTSQSKQVDVQVNQAILSQLVPNLEMAKITLRKETPLIQIIDRPILPLAKVQLSKFDALFIWGIIASLFAMVYVILRRFLKEL